MSSHATLAVIAASCLFALGACKSSSPSTTQAGQEGTTPAPSGAPEAPAEPAVSIDASTAAAPAPTKSETVRFTPGELKAAEDGMLRLCLDCNVRKARYSYCHFDPAALEASVGAERMGSELSVTVSMTPMASETYVPSDPNAPQPEGGFTHDTFTCTVVSIDE